MFTIESLKEQIAQLNNLLGESPIKVVRRGQIDAGSTLVSPIHLFDPCGLFILWIFRKLHQALG
jgi:hypothetical protein